MCVVQICGPNQDLYHGPLASAQTELQKQDEEIICRV